MSENLNENCCTLLRADSFNWFTDLAFIKLVLWKSCILNKPYFITIKVAVEFLTARWVSVCSFYKQMIFSKPDQLEIPLDMLELRERSTLFVWFRMFLLHVMSAVFSIQRFKCIHLKFDRNSVNAENVNDVQHEPSFYCVFLECCSEWNLTKYWNILTLDTLTSCWWTGNDTGGHRRWSQPRRKRLLCFYLIISY